MGNLESEDLKIYLDEVEKSFTSVREATNILDGKAYNLMCLLFPIITALCGYIFIAKDNVTIAFILLFGFFIALCYLYHAYKLAVYPSNGNRMEEILKEDSFYHKKTGLLIYLISDYQKKIECTIEKNFQKANNINNSIITIGITFALSILTHIVSIFLFSEETILILFL